MDRADADRVVRLAAAGGVVHRHGAGDSIEVVLGRQPDGKWRLPKGVSEAGETSGQTAVREVGEETGLSVAASGQIGQSTYTFSRADDGARCEKTVTFYLMSPVGGDLSNHDAEFERVDWVEWREAVRRLTFRNEAGIVEAAVAMVADGPPGGSLPEAEGPPDRPAR